MADPMASRTPFKGKIVNLRIRFLDGTVHAFQVPVKAEGRTLWGYVTRHLSLTESDYFGLQFVDSHGLKCWLDYVKPILKQLPSAESPLDFLVKFYTPDPGLLEEYTRYLFCLQIKADLLNGSMPCSENTAALIASYIVQAEIADFIVEEYLDTSYLDGSYFVPNQPPDFLGKVREYHKQHIGESPAEAEMGLLDTARKVETYGIRMCIAKDHEGVALNLAVAHMGILVFQNNTKINTFSWAKIRKLSFRRKKFLIKLHPETYVSGQKGYYKDTVEFFFESRDDCKNFWKRCIEHHAFFRCHTTKEMPRHKNRIVSRGSSFRYSGRTQKQLMSFVRENPSAAPQFQRSVSGRISAASRSTSVTPKIPAKVVLQNSAAMDAHQSMASSDSHVISTDALVTPPIQDHGETRSVDSSHSGSHSLHSPKFDRQRSYEGSPGIDISLDSRDIDEHPPVEVDEDRGAHFNVVKTKVSESVKTNEKLSANQNANDNAGVEAKLLPLPLAKDAGREDESTVSDPNNSGDGIISGGGSGIHVDDHNIEVIGCTNTSDKSGILSNIVHDRSHSTTPVRESKKVAFAADVKNDSEASEGDKEQVANNTGKLVIKFNEEVPAGACITVSVDVSPNHSQTASLVLENECDANVSVVMNDIDKHADVCDGNVIVDNSEICQESAAASGEIAQTAELADLQHGASQHAEGTRENGNDDLIEDIPYYLQRRHFEHETIEEIENDLNNSIVEEEAKEKSRLRRGRSSRKRRPINMQVEHVKVYEGSLERPVPCNAAESSYRSPSAENEHRRFQSTSPSGKRSPTASSRSPSGGARCSSRSSLERSPSCNRRVEIINFHKLPSKDNFSCVDDTTSPTFEKDILQQIQTKKQTIAVSSVQNGVASLNENIDVSSPNETKVDSHRIMPEICVSADVPAEKDVTLEPEHVLKDSPTISDEKNLSNENVKNSSIEVLRKESDPAPIDITRVPSESVIDYESPAAAFILAESRHTKKPNRNSITFSTFKPDEASNPSTPGSRPCSGDMDHLVDSQSETDYGSLPSAKKVDDQKPLNFELPSTEDIFQPTRRNIQMSGQRDSRERSVIHGPSRPRKVSFHRERGYMYSFESVNDPPSFSIAGSFDDSIGRKSTLYSSPDSDVAEMLDAPDDNEDMMESDTESDENCSASDSQSERESSDDEDVSRHDEFLKFAKSLADLGKEITVDSGVGVDLNDNSSNTKLSPLDPLEPLENLENTRISEEEKNLYNMRKGSCELLDRPLSKSYTDSSLSSCDFDHDKMFKGKRASIDPLAELENATLAEVESFSDASSDEGKITLVEGRSPVPKQTGDENSE